MAFNKRGFCPSGPTVLIAGAQAAPAAVQATNTNVNALDQGVQARMHNAGPNAAFVSFATTGAAAQTQAVIPMAGNPQSVIPIPAGAIEIITTGENMWWSAICAAGQTASVYITPGDGV